MGVSTAPVEIVGWPTRFVGGDGAARRVFEEPLAPDATVRSLLKGLSARFPELDDALYTLQDGLRVIAVMVASFVPDAADAILAAIGGEGAASSWDNVAPGLLPGGAVAQLDGPLFPRVDEPLA